LSENNVVALVGIVLLGLMPFFWSSVFGYDWIHSLLGRNKKNAHVRDHGNGGRDG